jgi:hypothetical protein
LSNSRIACLTSAQASRTPVKPQFVARACRNFQPVRANRPQVGAQGWRREIEIPPCRAHCRVARHRHVWDRDPAYPSGVRRRWAMWFSPCGVCGLLAANPCWLACLVLAACFEDCWARAADLPFSARLVWAVDLVWRRTWFSGHRHSLCRLAPALRCVAGRQGGGASSISGSSSSPQMVIGHPTFYPALGSASMPARNHSRS